MIATEVTATIYGVLSDTLYSGSISGKGIQRHSGYIISKKPVSESMVGIVTAVATMSDGTERPIVAPKNEIMYEPEIREILKALRQIEAVKLNCLYEKSCGAVILYKNPADGEFSILLVKNHNGRFFSFPKGHVELRENEKETAIREIKEETDLDVDILDGFREISDYCPFGKIRKRVVFFLAVAKTDKIKIQESEIDSYTWVPLKEAETVCSYDNDRRVIEKVRKYLADNNI